MTSGRRQAIISMAILAGVALAGALLLALGLPVQAQEDRGGPATDAQVIAELRDDGAKVLRHSETGEVRFVGATKADPVDRPAGLATDAPPEEAARAHLAGLDQLFGITDQARELRAEESEDVGQGRSTTEFQQVYKGVPVLGGEINAEVDADNNLLVATGEVSPKVSLDTEPGISADEAREHALSKIARDRELEAGDLETTEPKLWIYDPSLLEAPGPQVTRLVWRLEVNPEGELNDFRELVLVDAETGAVLLSFDEVAHARDRKTHNGNNTATLPGTLLCSETTNPCATGNTDAQNAHKFAGDTYDFYSSNHGRDSLNNAGMTLISTVDHCPDNNNDGVFECPYRNAFWDGTQMVYGDGMTADDVVGHELTHGFTDFESNLFYYYQSGAINESLSDVWGEFIDLSNTSGEDTAATRWLLGEDLPAGVFSPGGELRDMENPGTFGDPDRMLSPNYTADPDLDGNGEDSGGVHSNSGVNNKAAFLMTDGATFNGKTVTGLGITKVAKIYYEAQTNLLTSASDYQDLHSVLQQACANLTGTAGITATDCQEVKDAVDATEMHLTPTAAPNPEAPVCPTGQQPADIFSDDMGNMASGDWTNITGAGTNGWFYNNQFSTSGTRNLWGQNQQVISDTSRAKATGVAVPTGKTTYLRFNHSYGFEDGLLNDNSYQTFDGGVLEYSTNNGTTWQDAGSLITDNGYNGTIYSGFDNPIKGRQAFVGESNGYISSRVNLSSFAGQSVRFRFRIGTDTGFGDYGWFIDDVRVYTCETGTPPPGPANDNFANAQELTGASATATGSNANATKETGEPSHAGNAGGKSVWYSWTPQTSGNVTMETVGSNFDTLLAVYTGSAVNGLTQVASNDDIDFANGNVQSRVTFGATAGTTYRIAVDGFNGASGNVTLNLAQNPPPDTEDPTVSLTAPAVNAVVSGTSVTLSANATDNVGVTRVDFVRADNGLVIGTDDAAPYSVSWNSTSVEDGRRAIRAVAEDAAGNTASTADREFVVNNTRPDTEITTGPSGVGNGTTATFEFTSTENDSTFRCKLDGNPVETCSSPKTYTSLAQGPHTFEVKAVGAGGEANDSDASPATRSWTVGTPDTTPPDAPTVDLDAASDTGSSSTDDITRDDTPTFSGAAEANSTVRLSDGANQIGQTQANGSGIWSINVANALPEGQRQVSAKATDAANNTSPASATLVVTVDKTQPGVTITTPANNAAYDKDQAVAASYSCSDNAGGSGMDSCSGPVANGANIDTATAGAKTFTVNATDKAGNTATLSRNYTVNAPDTTPPGPVTDLAASPGDAQVGLTWTNPAAADFAATRVLRSTAGPATGPNPGSGQTQVYEGAGSSHTDTNLTNGTHYHYTAFTKDAAGNWSGPVSVSATPQAPPPEDTEAPNVVMTSPADGANVRGQSVTLAADATDNVGVTKVEFLVDGQVVGTDTTGGGTNGNAYSVVWDSKTMTDGRSTITARAYDAARNAESSRGIVVDNTYPDTRITGGPAEGSTTTQTTASFSFDNPTVERDVTFMCSLDNAPYATCTSPEGYDNLAQGQHVFRVKAVGAAGEAVDSDQTPAERRWTVGQPGDTTPPTVTSTTPANGARKVRLGANVTATFDEAMKASSLTTSTMTLKNTKTGATVTGATVTLSTDGKTVTFDPPASLAKKTRYEARITTGAQDPAGNALAADKTWSFTTGKK